MLSHWVADELCLVRRTRFYVADANCLGAVPCRGSLRGRGDSRLPGSPRVATRVHGTYVRFCWATQQKGATAAVTT